MSVTVNFGMVKPENQTKISDFVTNDANNLDIIDSELKKHSDAITSLTPIKVSNTVPSFAEDNTYADFPYRGTILISGVTEDMRPEVIFGINEVQSGNYASVCESAKDCVYIYSKVNTNITIPFVVVYKV